VNATKRRHLARKLGRFVRRTLLHSEKKRDGPLSIDYGRFQIIIDSLPPALEGIGRSTSTCGPRIRGPDANANAIHEDDERSVDVGYV
jgi:hypothetical protein